MGALENQLHECDKDVLIAEIARYIKRIDDLIAANNELVVRARAAEYESASWREVALTAGRTLAKVRAEITELAKTLDTLAAAGPAARKVLLQHAFAKLVFALDGKD